VEIVDDTDNAIWSNIKREKSWALFTASWSVSMPKNFAVKDININIGDILGLDILVNIYIGKGDIDPALVDTIITTPICFLHIMCYLHFVTMKVGT